MDPLADVELSCLEQAVKSNNAFSADIFHLLLAHKPGANIFYSPLSTMLTIGMVYEGSKCETSNQIEAALKLTQNDYHEGMRALKSSLSADSAAAKKASPSIINIANRVWINNGYSILEEYSNSLIKYYGSSIGVSNFSSDSDGARKIINFWVEEETKGHIKDLLQPGIITALTRVVLTNAIYFKGVWASKFNKTHTKKGNFTLSNNEVVQVDTMFISSKFKCAKFTKDNYETLMLPYADRKFTMVIMLPGKTSNIEKLGEMLKTIASEDLVNTITQGSVEIMVDAYIPKFKLEFQFEVSDVLKSLGISDLFDDNQADLSGISGTKDLFVSNVVHKAYIDVDEEGTTAAAATGMVIKVRCAVRKTLFNVDRPFGFFIMDNYAKSIVFMGAVLDPR